MATLRCMSTLLMTSGIPNDAAVNTFHVNDGGVEQDPQDIVDAWAAFMENNRGWFASTVATSGHGFKVYDLADPEPRAPILDTTWAFAQATSGTPLPSEVAVCISFEAARQSGQDQKRRRGRIYLGPISSSRNENGRPQASLLDDLVDNFQTFIGALNTAGYYFVVRSRVSETNAQVASIWVDNAFDTQRRRGLEVTSRERQAYQQIVV